jgi:hypothetical protein
MRQSLEDLKPGMILAADLVETDGRLLLPLGTVLTDRHLRYFQMWGVLGVEIEGDDAEAEKPAPVDPALHAAVEARLALRRASFPSGSDAV